MENKKPIEPAMGLVTLTPQPRTQKVPGCGRRGEQSYRNLNLEAFS